MNVLLFIVSVLPVLYVWSLGAFAQAPWKFCCGQAQCDEAECKVIDAGCGEPCPTNTWTNKCSGFPKCDSSLIGISVSMYIATPTATGLMAVAFFHPMFHLWSIRYFIKMYVFGGIFTLTAFYLCFGAFLACPVTKYPTMHTVVVGLFCVFALFIYYALLKHVKADVEKRCMILLVVSMISFSGVIIVNVLSQILPNHDLIDSSRQIYSPEAWFKKHGLWWTFYFFEASGLSCMAVFPWFWRARDGVEIQHGGTFYAVPVCGSEYVRPFILCISCLPAAYLFLLPWLSNFALPQPKPPVFWSISKFISTTQATGAMAAVFFFPLAHMWSSRKKYAGLFNNQIPWLGGWFGRFGQLLQGVCILFFFVFLSCPETVSRTAKVINNMAVTFFSILFVSYYIILVMLGAVNRAHKVTYSILGLSIVGIVLLSIYELIHHWDESLIQPGLAPWVPWLVETISLSLMASLIWLLDPKDEARTPMMSEVSGEANALSLASMS